MATIIRPAEDSVQNQSARSATQPSEENEQDVRMSGVIDSSASRRNRSDHHISAAFADRAVQGTLWGAEPASSKF
jgi:hypothetical protein